MGEAKNIYFTCLKANFQKDFVSLYPTTKLIQDAERSRRIRRPLHSQKMLRFQQDHRSRRSCIRADQHRYGGRKDGPNDGENKTYAICGKIRGMGESDDSLIRLAKKDGVLPSNI